MPFSLWQPAMITGEHRVCPFWGMVRAGCKMEKGEKKLVRAEESGAASWNLNVQRNNNT